MQNQTKKILASALFAVLGLGMLWAVGQSQATPSSTTNNITIKDIERNQSSKLKTLFLAEEKAAQTNTNPSSIEKVRLVIDEQGSLNTYATSRLLDDSQGGQSSSNINSSGSVVGGIGNRNTQETSIIIGGEDNTIQGNQGFIGGGSTNTVKNANSSVLGSSGVNLEGANTFAIGSNEVNILANNATAIAGKNISITEAAEGSLAIGNQITIAKPGTFAFNTKSEELTPQIEHSFVVNTDYGVLVNKDQSVNPEIQLNVGGAIRVGEVAKSSTIPALVQKSHGGSYSCVCFGTTAITQTDACQQICNGQTPNIKPECGPNAKAYGKDDNNWAAGVDESNFCRKGKLDPNVQNNFPKPGKNVTWKCKGIGHPDKICEATRYFCGDGIPQTGEQCDTGVLNGDPQSNCSTTCKTVAAPACGNNASAYTHTATTWKNQTAKGFCSEGTIKGTQPPFFTPAPITLPTAPSCNKCGLKGFPYCFDVSFDPNSEACRDTNTPITGETHKNWTCKNANNAEVHCEATRALPEPGQCGTAHNVLKDSLTTTSSDLCQQGTVSDFGEDTTKFTNRWSWKCQGTANTPAASCTAHKPQPQAGQCGTTLNSCDAGTPETNNTLTNGTRWICKGANQGADTVCSVCNERYTYNRDTHTCIPKTEQVQCAKTGAPANASYVAGTVNVTWNGTARSTPANCAWTCNSGYTQQGNNCVKDAPVCDTANGFNLHNGHCAKWSCDRGTTTTSGRCENKSTNSARCVAKTNTLLWDMSIGLYDLEAACNSKNQTTCADPMQIFYSMCRTPLAGGSLGNNRSNDPTTQNNYIVVTRAEAKKLLQDNPNNQNPCTASTANIIYGHKPTCTSPQIWYCPHTPDANFDSIRNKPACERQEPINCASLSENSCKSQSSTCTRKPGSSSTTTGYKCIRQDGQPATAADCDSTWIKPSCTTSVTCENGYTEINGQCVKWQCEKITRNFVIGCEGIRIENNELCKKANKAACLKLPGCRYNTSISSNTVDVAVCKNEKGVKLSDSYCTKNKPSCDNTTIQDNNGYCESKKLGYCIGKTAGIDLNNMHLSYGCEKWSLTNGVNYHDSYEEMCTSSPNCERNPIYNNTCTGIAYQNKTSCEAERDCIRRPQSREGVCQGTYYTQGGVNLYPQDCKYIIDQIQCENLKNPLGGGCSRISKSSSGLLP